MDRAKNYPDSETLIAWAHESISLTALAKRVGVRRESLRDYLSIRPELEREVKAAARLTREQVAANEAESKKNWKASNPDKVREYNRRWARNQSAEKRHIWNSYNRRRRTGQKIYTPTEEDKEFMRIVQNDSCAYCGGPGGTADHIIAIAKGGTDSWQNYTGSCASDNASKGTQDVLQFMLRKSLEYDRMSVK